MEDASLDQHAQQLAALGHPIRLRALRFIVRAGPGGASAGAIAAHVDLVASTLSHHLKRLVDADLVTTRPETTYLYYSANYQVLRSLTNYLWEDCCRDGAKPCC